MTKYNIQVGDIMKSNLGGDFKIIDRINSEQFCIEFQDNFKFCGIYGKSSIIRGYITNPYTPTIFGVGYFGEGRFKSKTNSTIDSNSKRNTKEYNAWINMLQRCYYDKYICRVQGYKSYDTVTVCDAWHNFQTFAEWYSPRLERLQKLGEKRYHLDKDILAYNKEQKLYSPDTCCVIPMRLNNLVINCNLLEYNPIVIKHLESWSTTVSIGKSSIHLHKFKTENEAIVAGQDLKKAYAKSLISEYSEVIDLDVITNLCTMFNIELQ